MKSCLARKTSITLPASLEKELRRRARAEHRTLSGIIQEATRSYLRVRQFEAIQQKLAPLARRMGLRTEDDVDRLVHEARREDSL